MIMAGRGRRLTDPDDEPKKIGAPQGATDTTPVDVPSLTKKINEINASNINPSLLADIEKMIKQMFTSGDVMKDVMSQLHSQSLEDCEFGEKLVVALEPVKYLVADDTNIRNILLSLIQNDFNEKDVMSKTNPKKFVNLVMLLGNVFNTIKVGDKPISVLAHPLFQCFDLLLKGESEEMKTVVKQILINGSKLSENDEYKQFMHNLRNTLVTGDLNSSSRTWILLAIEFTSNGFQPLKEGIRDFYVTSLGEEYTKLESLIPVAKDKTINSPVSPERAKNQESEPWRVKKSSTSPNEGNHFKKDLSKKFSNMSVTTGSGKKVQSPPGKNQKKDTWKSGGGMRNSGHDDRFEKEENFYGVQKPRQPKPENQRKKFGDDKKEFEHFKTDNDGKVQEAQTQPVEGGNWG